MRDGKEMEGQGVGLRLGLDAGHASMSETKFTGSDFM